MGHTMEFICENKFGMFGADRSQVWDLVSGTNLVCCVHSTFKTVPHYSAYCDLGAGVIAFDIQHLYYTDLCEH